MDGLWSTFLGIALPLVGVDTAVLEAAGYTRVPETCGTISAWDRQHSATYAIGYSHALFGEILVVASTEDETLRELVVIAGSPFEGDPLRLTRDECTTPAPSHSTEENELGIDVVTKLCADGSGVVMRSVDSADHDSCRFLEQLRPSPFLISSFLPRRY